MKKLFLVLTGIYFSLTLVNLAVAGTATIYGTVTDSAGNAVASTTVEIKVRGTFRTGDDFPWASKKVNTNSSGYYSTKIQFPDILEQEFVAEVIKTNKKPFQTGFKKIEFLNTKPQNNGKYQLDITLSAYTTYGVVIQGQIKDSVTGEPLSNYLVNIGSYSGGGAWGVWTNGDGFYKCMIWLNNPSDKISLTVPYESVEREEVKYAPVEKIVTVNAGTIYTYNFSLNKDATTGYIFGTVVDASNGIPQPIPYAKLEIISFSDTWERYYPTTDFLGRYKQYVTTTSMGPKYYSVRCIGAHTIYAEYSPYYEQTISAPFGYTRVDFDMIKK